MNSDAENKPTVSQSADLVTDLDVNTEAAGPLSKRSSSESAVANLKVRETVDKAAHFLDEFPGYLNQTFSDYQKPLTTVGIILALLIAVALADGVLDVINAIPLMAPILELVGLGYTGWFAWRYLRYAETRQEFLQNYRNLKNRITGEE